MTDHRRETLALSRRTFIKAAGGAGAGFVLFSRLPGGMPSAVAAIPGGDLNLGTLAKYVTPMLIPPVMPMAGTLKRGRKSVDYYEISMRQFPQQILPAGQPATTVWGYGPTKRSSKRGLLLHNAPSLTIEARANRPVRIKWINDLVDSDGSYLPHLLPVDPTLHWANPPGGTAGRDSEPMFDQPPERYTGPVPTVTHVHGAVGVGDESDGYPEAWYLPDARDIPAGYATEGTWYDFFRDKAQSQYGATWGPGFATFQYPNPDRASTNWYHDHTLGMTRVNVYTGPAGFYIIRGGPDDVVRDSRTGSRAALPGPAPRADDKSPPNKAYREIPIAIQDRAFNKDGSLFYPDSRAFFDGITGPFIPDGAHGFSPIWNPEFFGNTMMVNGNTWPFQVVERRRYRFRFLNGCQSRFLILDFADIPGVRVWQIGNEGGFLSAPVNLTALGSQGNRLPMGLAERADVIVDFTDVPVGDYVLRNVGPDDPFGGGAPEVDFDPADADTTGQVMQFRVRGARRRDDTTPPQFLKLPAVRALAAESVTRQLALIEVMGMGHDANDEEVEGPVEALLGTVEGGVAVRREWIAPVTENPDLGATEVWEFYNTTGDAHPIHVHETVFEVVNRQGLTLDGEGAVLEPITMNGPPMPPELGESGFKDTVTAFPGQVTRVRAKFDRAGQYVWHCHILEHEDNEMMRPYRIGPVQHGQPGVSPH